MSLTSTITSTTAQDGTTSTKVQQQTAPSAQRSSIKVITPDPRTMMLTPSIPHRSVSGLTPVTTPTAGSAPTTAALRSDSQFGNYILGQTLGEGEISSWQRALTGLDD